MITTQTQRKLDDIAFKLSVVAFYVKLKNKIGHTDLNHSLERFYIPILNLLYKLKLENLNAIQSNYPAIDLGDRVSRTCIQVTSTNTNNKYKKTVEKFKEKKLNQKYDKLWFLLISEKEKCSLQDKDLQTKIIDNTDLYKKISDSDISTINTIHQYLQENIFQLSNMASSFLPIKKTGIFNEKPNKLIHYLQLDNENTHQKDLIEDLKNLFEILILSHDIERKFLFYIVHHGQLVEYDNFVYITTAELNIQFHEQGKKIFDSLSAKKILGIDHDYEINDMINPIIYPYMENIKFDLNLFGVLKSFCAGDRDLLYRVLVECDFSQL